jgi:tight adherence protein C
MTPAMLAMLTILLTLMALLLIAFGLRTTRRQVIIEERLAQFGYRVPTLEELELQQPFRDRVLLPALTKVSQIVLRLAPQANLKRVEQRLMEAGAPPSLTAPVFIGIRVIFGFGLGLLMLLVVLPAGASPLAKLVLPLSLGAMGFVIPNFWLSRQITRRKHEITRALPDVIDLLSISVEAGLGFDQALSRVVEKWDNALTRELGRMLSEMRMGVSRRQAMRDLAARLNVDDLNVFIASLLQADQLGISISQVLRVQSHQMRLRRRQRAQELAQKAPIKMLFPMIFFIFPAIYIVILGPALPKIATIFR